MFPFKKFNRKQFVFFSVTLSGDRTNKSLVIISSSFSYLSEVVHRRY